MKKAARRSLFVDRAHKGFVCVCIAVTLYGCYGLGMRFHRYFTVIRPERQQKELLAKEQLLAEGSSDRLMDKAPNLKL